MLDPFIAALVLVWDPTILGLVFLGVFIGLIFGVLPGLGGLSALAILIPFIYGQEPLAGLGFLLATHASVYTGGSVSAILLGIPGSPPNAATVIDGFALHRCGRGLYAVGAALTASALGGLASAVLLSLMMPLLKPVVLAFSAPEIFMISLIGLSCVAMLGQGAPVKGLIAAGLGAFLAQFGYQGITGVPRFWFGVEYLLDGMRLIPLILGLFAIPEIVSLASGNDRRPSTAAFTSRGREMYLGVVAVLKRPLLFFRSVFIGVVVGIIPGIGGETAPFIAYAAAQKQRSTAERTTDDMIEGVIAPESSNNAKEGGALVPTLALGIPGSAAMSLLLGGFLILGLDPGPSFLSTHLDLAIGLAIILAVTNLMAALVMAPLATAVARLANIRGQILAPFILLLVILGAFSSSGNTIDVMAVFVFGGLGLVMLHFNYSRPALLLGFILAPILETYLHISLQAYGAAFLLRPLTLSMVLVFLLALLFKMWARRKGSSPEKG
jgi:putative tricarboxylic transport membrane protein